MTNSNLYIIQTNPQAALDLMVSKYGVQAPEQVTVDEVIATGDMIEAQFPAEFTADLLQIHPDKDSILKMNIAPQPQPVTPITATSNGGIDLVKIHKQNQMLLIIVSVAILLIMFGGKITFNKA